MTLIILEKHFNRLQLREKALLLTATLAVLLFVFSTFFYRPLQQQQKNEAQQQQDALAQREQLMSELASLKARHIERKESPEWQALKNELDQTNRQIAEQTEHMVPPGEMYEVLRRVLQKQKGIQLVSLAHGDRVSSSDSNQTMVYYKHPMRITVRGSYFDVLRYLQDLENLPWRLQWEGLHYDVQQYPEALVSVDVASLSQQQDWLR